MKRYRDFQPTEFDPKGLALDDQQDWLVIPCSRNRDSNCLSESNFHTALKLLGGESETVEVHSFNHWACGWFEIIIVHPSREIDAQDIEDSLENYPILDEMDFSDREYERAGNYWEHCRLKDRIDICRQYGVSIFAARRDSIPEDVDISYLAE